MIIAFTIPGCPTAWQRAATFKGRKLTPKGMREAQRKIGWLCKAAMGGAAPLLGALRLEVLAVYAVPVSWPNWKQLAALEGAVWKTSVPDHDNLVKQISDALNGIAYADDAQVARTSLGKRYGMPQRTDVRVSLLDGLSDHSHRDAFTAWAQERRGQLTLPAPGVETRNTLTHVKGPGDHG